MAERAGAPASVRAEGLDGLRARRLVGVAGTPARVPFGAALHASGATWRPVLTQCAVAFTSAWSVGMLVAIRDGAKSSLGDAALGLLPIVGPAAFAAGGLGAASLLATRPNARVRALGAALVGSALAALGVGLATSPVSILLAALVVTAGSGVATAVVLPMVLDSHVPELRGRAVTGYAAALLAGGAAAQLAEVVGRRAGATWRADALLAAALLACAAVASRRIGLPAVGRFDRARISHAVSSALGGGGDAASELAQRDVSLTVAEQLRRVLAPASAGPLVGIAALFGMVTVALPPYLDQLLRDSWVLVAPSRTLFVSGCLLVAAPLAVCIGPRVDVALRRSPSRALDLAGRSATGAALALGGAGIAPFLPVVAMLLVLAAAAITAALAVAVVVLLTLCEPSRRSYAATVIGLATSLGALIGQQAIETIGSRFGVAWAVETAALLIIGVGGGVATAVASVDHDLDRTLERMVEDDQLATRVSRGEHLPLLSCRHLDFSYGQVQVLFDVSFTVDDGEMVALLGTNGAGKSTLLRLISGLSFPSAGAIQYRGADITFLDTDRRVQLGIAQVPGGKAAFGNMTVVDNLRAFGHAIRRDHAKLERGIDESLHAFPRLAERRNQLASTLSGGEQQMLAVSKALILRPRLLLIDELSLGLAPIVVAQLLEMVRKINEAGTAVVLVEQSVNVALSVVDHAYFMEKGEMRFDGSAADLIARPDLLRSVFLQGATQGLVAEAAP